MCFCTKPVTNNSIILNLYMTQKIQLWYNKAPIMLSPGVKHCTQHVCQVECTEQVTQWQSKTAANSWRLHVSLMFAEKEQTEVVEGSFDPTALFIFPERAAGPPFPLSRPHWLLYRWHLCKCRTRGAHVTRRKHLSTSGFNIILEA